MADPLTTNIQLAVPLRGTDVGTWDVPVNGDFTLIDSMFGGVQSFALTNTSFGISVAQAQNSIIRLTGTLTANVVIAMSSAISKFWTIDNQITNSPSTGYYVAISNYAASQQIGIPPGPNDIFYDGTTVNYRNLGRIGEYWDFAGTQVPNWVTATTKPPYLNCNGTSFSTSTYPVLANLLGSGTLPDLRGVVRATLNQGTSRMTSSAGVDGTTIFSIGGTQGTVIASSNLPSHGHTVTDPGHAHVIAPAYGDATGGRTNGIISAGAGAGFTAGNTNTANTSITITGSTYANIPTPVMQPTTVAGITMIRAA